MSVDTPTGTVTFEPCKECDQKDGKITRLTTALDESVAKCSLMQEFVEAFVQAIGRGQEGSRVEKARLFLANPNPAVAEWIRDREIARLFEKVIRYMKERRWEPAFIYQDDLNLWRELNASPAAEEEPSHPDPNEVATPDVVADLQSGRW